MLEITEIFHSLQGEGPLSGRPAAFIRLSGCIEPLCPWCDTIYACGAGRPMPLNTVFGEIVSLGSKLVVITGGEPFLQWETGLKQLETRLLDRGYQVQYETSGKIEIPSDAKGFSVCSPKFIDGCWVFDEVNLVRARVFKFVVDADFDEVLGFVQQFEISPDRVFIMPKGASREEQLVKFPDAWAFCVENSFHFSPRLHILTFDNKRGV